MNNKTNVNYISLADSIGLNGVAILLMIFHHCFCIPARLNDDYYPVLGGFEIESRIALAAKICVVIYASVSGYALSKKQNPYLDIKSHFIYDFKISASLLLKLYSRLWLVCILFLPIGAIFFNKTFTIDSLIPMITMGIGYNIEWWYVLQYIIFMFVFPFVDTIFFLYEREKKPLYIWIIIVLCLLIVCLLVFNCFIPFAAYTTVFILLFVIGRFNIYEKISSKLQLSLWVDIMGIIILFCIRWFTIINPFEARIDILIAPILIFLLTDIIHKSDQQKPFAKMIACMGKYSTFMWLSHTFLIYYFFQKIALLPYYSILIYIWAVILSLITAWVLEKIYEGLKIKSMVKNVQRKLLSIN